MMSFETALPESNRLTIAWPSHAFTFRLMSGSDVSQSSHSALLVTAQAAQPGTKIAVIGDGKFGLLIAQARSLVSDRISHADQLRKLCCLDSATPLLLPCPDTAERLQHIDEL